MLLGKRALWVTAALLVAFAAGHAAETLKSSSAQKSISIATVSAAELGRKAVSQADSAVPPAATLAAGGGGAKLQDLVGITSVAATLPKLEHDACSPGLALAAAPGAMINLTVTAPCNAGQRIVVRHSGLSFTARTGPDGRASLTLPALKREALVAVYLEEARLLLGRVDVPDAASYTHFALVWDAPNELDLRVTQGEKILVGSPHVFRGTAPSVVSLGSTIVQSPLLAQVFSIPGSGLDGAEITAELRITPFSCGRTLRVMSLLSQDGVVTQTELPISVPLCGTSGDILVLKNLAPGLTLAPQN